MTTPGRIAEAWQAGTDPNATQQQQVNAATQGALEALGLSSMGFKPHGALGTFIFRNSPMFDNAAAAQFEKLENKRKLFGLGKPYSVEELLERTGTIRTGEGLMQEISDRGATFNPNFVTTDPVTGMKITNFPKDKAYTLESAVQHPYYYMAVPEAQNASISALGTVNPASARKRGTMGLFYPDVNHIEVRNKLPVAHTNDELVDPGRMGALSYTLHEMQHLADKASGKKSGASVELPATFDRELAKAESQYRRANRTRDSVIEQNNLQGTEAEIDAQLSRIAPSVLSDAQQAAANMQRLRAMEHEAFAKYEADVGEQRARATEQRRLMTDAERRKNFPIGADKW